MLACRYFDGRSSRARPASVTMQGTAIRIVGDDVDRVVTADEMRFAPATDLGPARIAFASGGLCEFADRAAADALFADLGFRPARVDRLSSRTRHAVVIAVAFVVVMAAIYRWGIPWASDEIVTHLPREWDQALGEKVLGTLDERHFFRPTTLSEERRERITRRFAALRMPLAPAGVVIVFRRLGVPNALALPGNIVVVTDEIVVAAPDDDAILTVLAHETGHIDHRDAMHRLVRSAMTSIVAAWYLGDVSNAAAVVAGGMGTLTYSREAEHAADLYALRAMRANDIPTRSAAELFRRLEGWRPSTDDRQPGSGPTRKRDRMRIPEYLSTHPATEDRIGLFESGEANGAGAR